MSDISDARAQPEHVHFVGIGGIHMSALAHILLDDGLVVSGCDRADTPILQPLRERGAEISIGHEPGHIARADRVIRTVAVAETHPEIAAAAAAAVPVSTRAELLAEIAAGREVIAVGGAHGKTTTTAMLAVAARASGRDVGYVLGGETADLVRHAARGADPWLILEADEYGRAFHHYTPRVALITNVEPDHLDYYGTVEQLEAAFLDYARTLVEGGVLIVGADSPPALQIAERLSAERPDITVTTAGLSESADWRAEIALRGERATCYRVRPPAGGGWPAQLGLAGEFNVANAIAALAALDAAGFDAQSASHALAQFRGVARRLQRHGEADGVLVLDDYAHHPTEIAATIGALRQRHPDRRLLLLFQPHTYSRSRYLLDGFRSCFAGVDRLFLCDTYAARERPEAGLTAAQLAAHLVAEIDQPDTAYAGSVADAAATVADAARRGDVVVTVGAGDVDAAGPLILAGIRDGLAGGA